MPHTILVTGSLGYLGSRLTGTLMDAGYRVIGFDTGFFRDCTLYQPHEPKTILKDLRELHKDDLKGVDTVVHLAGISNDPMQSLRAEQVYDPTRVYTLRLAELCKSRGIRFIFPSSCSVYGMGQEGWLTEKSPTFPQTPYSLNKLQIEGDLQQIGDRSFCPIILRLATVYGLSPRIRFDVVVNMLTGMAFTTGNIVLNSDGKAWRPHIHIDDVCKVIKASVDLDGQAEGSLIINVGDTKETFQVVEVARMVQECVPGSKLTFLNRIPDKDSDQYALARDAKIRDGVDSRSYKVSFGLLSHWLPTFQCDHSVQQGVESMVRAFDEMGLTKEQFTDPRFYRLQELESLLKSGSINAKLFWAVRE